MLGAPSGTSRRFDGVALLVSGTNRHPGMVQARLAKLGQAPEGGSACFVDRLFGAFLDQPVNVHADVSGLGGGVG